MEINLIFNIIDQCKAMSEAVATNSNIDYWINIEIYNSINSSEPNGQTPTLDIIDDQFQMETKYTNKFLCFSYFHYYCPLVKQAGFHDSYVHYQKTGLIPTDVPKPIENMQLGINYATEKYVALWDSQVDQTDIVGYLVYLNGELVTNHQYTKTATTEKFTPITETGGSIRLLKEITIGIESYNAMGIRSPRVEKTITI